MNNPGSNWVILSLLLVVIIVNLTFVEGRFKEKCPKPKSKLICKSQAKLKVIIEYKLRNHKCHRIVKKIPIKIKCPKRTVRHKKCINGVSKRIISTFKIHKCNCINKELVKKVKCPCPKTKTYRHKCKKGERKVTTIYHVRKGWKCRSKKRVHVEICETSKGWKPKHACQCYHYGRGNVLTFDKRRLLASTSGRCSILLSKWINKKSMCSYLVFVVTQHGKFSGQLIHYNNKKYLLTNKKKLYVNGVYSKLPFYEKNVRIFFSGDYLQFVAPKCNIAIAYNGHGGGYLSVGLFKNHPGLSGICGNCNGNPLDDKLDKNYAGGDKNGNCKPISGQKMIRKCLGKYSRAIGHKFCGRLSGEIENRKTFMRCKHLAFKFYRGCIKDVCHEWPNNEKMLKAACKVHEMAAEACREKNAFFLWRSKKFCPLKCPTNKIFVTKMDTCPRTCENFFFETSRRCFKLPRRNGCDCKKGYVQDGNQCVKPNKCRCLNKVCFDRLPKSKCNEWKNQGRCTNEKDVMQEFCRQTCNFCNVKCQDQVSTRVCQKMKKKGKCKSDFYKQMCRLTCYPESCKCPDCRTLISKCHPKYKYRITKKICYKLNKRGRCTPLVSRTYAECGVCPKVASHTRTPCDFCKGYRWSIVTSFFRDKSVKKRCKHISSKSKEPCKCRNEKGSFTKCVKDTTLMKVKYVYGNSKCRKCVKRTYKKVLKKAECRGTWITSTPCIRKHRIRYITYHRSVAKDCKCNHSSRKVEIMCKCPKIQRKGPVCENNKWVFYQIGYRMKSKHECQKVVTKSHKYINCKKGHKIIVKCNRRTCRKSKYTESWSPKQCQCRLNVKKSDAGKCCCPKTKVTKTLCLGYYILMKKILYVLNNGECTLRVLQRKIRCRCPKKQTFKYCDKKHGLIVNGVTKFYLTKYHTCKKNTKTWKVPIECHKIQVRRSRKCVYSRSNSKTKYRKVVMKYKVRHGCKCKTKVRVYKEPCSCEHHKDKKVIPCSKKCLSGKHCPRNCYKIVKWFKYSTKRGRHSKNKKCIKHLIKIRKRRCCCRKNLRRTKKCVKHKYWKIRIAQTKLNHSTGKCYQVHHAVFNKVHCKVGFLKSIKGRKMKNGKQIIKSIYGYIKNCKCRFKTKKRVCIWKCPKRKVRVYCDKNKRSKVKMVLYEEPRGCKCQKRIKRESKRIFCPIYKKKIDRKCNKKSKFGYDVYKKSYQIGCKCKSKKLFKKVLCKCPKSKTTKPVCVYGKKWLNKKIHYRLHHNKVCEKSIQKLWRRVKCSKKIRIIPKCLWNSGKYIKIKKYFQIRHCKCVPKSKIIFQGKCNCKGKIGSRRVKCNRKTNKWVHINSFWVHDKHKKRCIKKQRSYNKPVYCHKSRKTRGKCNTLTKRRKYVFIIYKRKNCSCRLRKKVLFKRCGCPKFKPKITKFCDKKQGNFVTLKIYKKWNERANKCIRVVKKKESPIYCKREIRLYKSKCNGKFYTEKLVKKYKNAKTCSCKVRIRHWKRNCHCPTRVIVKKCTKKTGFMGKKLIIFKEWHNKSKKCVTSNIKKYLRRCKCPKGAYSRKCYRGKWVSRTRKYKLRHGKCIRITKSNKFKIYCKKPAKKIVGKCNKKTCTKLIKVYAPVLDKHKCRCIWKRIKVKKCKCCGCPKSSSQTKCYKDKYIKTKLLFFKGQEGKCSYKCKAKRKVFVKRFRCKIQLPKPHWTKCDKSECKKDLIGWKMFMKNCKCLKRKYLITRKTCCCPYKPKVRKYCKHGKWVKSEKHIKLRNHKCVAWYKRKERKIKCKHLSKKIFQKCDRKHCQQNVLMKKLVLNHSKCKCVMKTSFLYKMPCCCKKRPYVKRFCDGKCKVTKKVAYKFDRFKKSCVRKVKFIKNCKECPKVQSIRGQCNRKTCLKFTYHYKFFIHKCKCIKQSKKIAKICCCPKPHPWTRKCIHNQIVKQKKYYKLVNNHCEKRRKVRKYETNCKTGTIKSRKISKCSKVTCTKRITKVFRTQKGCRCGLRKTVQYLKCCCPKSKKFIRCEKNKYLVKYTKYWYFHKHKCHKKQRKFIIQKIKHCKDRKYVGKCSPHSKFRTIKFVLYRPKNCKCRPVKTRVKKILCACPRPVKRVSKCNKKTCLKTMKFILFKGPISGRHCKRKVKMSSWKCCCLGKKKWKIHKCNKNTGNKETIYFIRLFDSSNKSCKTMRKRKVHKTHCSKHLRAFNKGCNKKTGWKVIQKSGWKKDHKNCGCRKFRFFIKKRCSCNHLKCSIYKPKCIHKSLLKSKKKCYRMKHGKCVPEYRGLIRNIHCPKKPKIIKKCSQKTCGGVIIIKRFVKHKCRCKPKVQYKKFVCCCPRSMKYAKCKGDSIEYTSINYKYQKKHKSCKKVVLKRTKVIKCKPKHVTVKKCNRHTCIKAKIVRLYRVHKCKCKLKKIRKILRKCCCPKMKSKLKCYKKYGVIQHVQYKYKLRKGTCVVQKMVEQDKISCTRTKFIRFKCNKRTKKRKIKIISYKRIGCKCKRNIKFMKTLCACKKPRIIKGKCINKRQSVYQVVYRLKKSKKSRHCVKSILKLYTDQCACKHPRIMKRCKFNQIQIRKIQYDLKHRKGRKFCHMQDSTTYHRVSCPKKKHYKTKCHKYKMKLVTVFYRLKHCKCVPQKTVKYQACNCHKRNSKSSYCKDGVVFNVQKKFYSNKGVIHCLMHSMYKTRSINCDVSKVKVPLSKKCNIKRNYGYYKNYLLTWKKLVGCKCIKYSKKISKLCHCKKNVEKVRCIADDTLKIYRRTVTKAGKHCLPKKEIITRDIQCNGDDLNIVRYPCSKFGHNKCYQKIKITEKWVENCKCKHKKIIIRRRCCARKPITVKYCDAKRHQRVQLKTFFKLTPGKLLYRKNDFMLMDKKLLKYSIRQRQDVICPSRSVTEKCEKKTGQWLRRITSYKRVGCKCLRKIKLIKGKCRCPEKKMIISKCVNEFQKIKTVIYHLIDDHCVRFSHSVRQRCDCPPPISRIYCDGEGRWVKCLTEFKFDQDSYSCNLEKRCVRWDQMCGEPYRVESKCNKVTKKRVWHHFKFKLDEVNCKCIKKRSISKEYCSCKHKNRAHTKCVDNVMVTKKTKFTLISGQCSPTRLLVKRKIKCPSPIKKKLKCNKNRKSRRAGYRKIIKIIFINIKCRCVRKQQIYFVPCKCNLIHRHQRKTFCKNGNIFMKRFKFYVLFGKKCISRTKYMKKDIICEAHKSKPSKCISSHKSKISYRKISIYHKATKNCKCIWKLKKIYRKICKCPPKYKKIKCLKNKTIRKSLIFFIKHKSGKKCVRHQSNRYHKIKCGKKWKTAKCSKSTCTLYITKYREIPRKCKCHVIRSTSKAKCCCPKPTKKRSRCDQKKNRIVKTWFTYKLKHKKCYKKRKQSSYTVRCERQEPRIRLGKCVKHYRTVYIISKRSKHCRCVSYIKKMREKCGCPKKIIFHKGKCHHKFAKDKWSALEFLKKTKKCVRVVIQKRLRRCQCPRNKMLKKCVRHSNWVSVKTRYLLRSSSNSCRKLISRSKRNIGCSIQPRLTRVQRSKCSKSTGYYKTEIRSFKVAKNCHCVKFNKVKSWPCNCKKLNRTKRLTKCIRNRYLTKIIKYSKLQGKKCIWRLKKSSRKIKCHGSHKKVGKCNKKTKHRIIKIYKKTVINCRCKWQLFKLIKKRCKCPRPIKKVKCVNGKTLMKTKIRFYLSKHKCIKKRSQVKLPIPCNEGTRIHESKCDFFSGYKKIRKITEHINKCQCSRHSSVRKCRCKCPRNTRYTVCLGKRGLIKTTKVKHRLTHCKCITNRKVTLIKVKCPKSSMKRTKCKAIMSSKYHDKYKYILKHISQRHGCKCVKSMKKKRVLCSCNPKIRKIKKCVKNKYVITYVTKRVKSHGKCKRIEIDSDKEVIECPEKKVRKWCNKKSGFETIVIKKWFQKNCKCIMKKSVRKRKCKCDSKQKLVRRIKCNKKCESIKIYRHKVLRNFKCVFKYIARRRKCCCPKLHKSKTKCLQNMGMLRRTSVTFKLVKGHCIKHYYAKKKFTKCRKGKTMKSKKLPKGLIKIIISRWRRVGCKCKIFRKIKYKTWSCPKSYKKTRCINAPESSKETVTVRYKMMSKTIGCKKLVLVKRIPTECHPDRTYWTKCKQGKYGYFKTLVQITYAAKNCRCLKSVDTTPTLCKCDKPAIRKYCAKSQGLRVQTITHYVPDSGDHKSCMPVKTKQQYRIICNKHFRFSHKTKCSRKTNKHFIVEKAEKRVGCKCKTVWKKKSCLCRCPHKKIIKRCRKDNVKERITIRWTLIGCKCKKLVNSHLQTVHCPRSSMSHHKCIKCRQKKELTRYMKKHCKCVAKKKKRYVKCCCPKMQKQRKCARKSGRWITRKIVYKLSKGRCYKNQRERSQKIVCSNTRKLRMVGPCVGKKQKYSLTTFVRKGCGCVKRSRYIFKNCLCLKKSATEVIFLVDQTVSSRYKHFQQAINGFLKHTVSMFPIGKKSYRFALVKYSEKPFVIFNLNSRHRHKHLFSRINKMAYVGKQSNLAKALLLVKQKIIVRSRPSVQKIVYIISDGVNDKTGHLARRQIQWMQKHGIKVSAIAVKPTKQGMVFLKRLIQHKRSSLWSLRKNKDFANLPFKLLHKICKNACPMGKVRNTKCSKYTNCQGFTYIYGYRSIGKQCLRKVTKKSWVCCCKKKKYMKKVCHKNRLLLIKISWKYYKKSCVKIVQKRDISRRIIESCKPHKQFKVGHCGKSNYKTILLIRRKIRNCKCQKSIKKRSIKCRCSRSKRLEMCKKDKYKIKVKLYQSLVKGKCIKRKKFSKTPIVCRKPKMEKLKCNKITCMRKIRFIHYKARKCHCKTQIKTVKEKCCCPLNKETRKYCKKNMKIYKSSWTVFDRKHKVCKRKSKSRVRKIKCSRKPKIRESKCNIRKGKVWYKLRKIQWYVAINCKCVKMRRIQKLPCKCSSGKTFKRCTSGGIVKLFRTNYKLLKSRKGKRVIGICKKVTRVVWSKKHKCTRKVQTRYGSCSKNRSGSTKYRKVNSIHSIRKGCKCVTISRRSRQICHCPTPRNNIKCLRHKYRVTFKVYFNSIMGRDKKRKCVMRTSKSTKKIKCRSPKIHHTKCVKTKSHRYYRTVRTTIYVVRHCKCRQKSYLRKIKCHSKTGALGLKHMCDDLLPMKMCRKVMMRSGCKKSHIYSQKLCKKTCGKCSKCQNHNKKGFKIRFRSCLVTDRRYGRKLMIKNLKNMTYKKCKHYCSRMSKCKSFDFYIKKLNYKHGGYGDCILNKVNVRQLEMHMYPRSTKLGTNYHDLKRHHANHCILSEKACIKKCDEPRVKKLGKCKCRRMKKIEICYRKSLIYYNVINGKGHCLRRIWKGLIPCKHDACNDWKSHKYCYHMKKSGKCANPVVFKLCQKTCTGCKCSKSQEYNTKCSKSGHKLHLSIDIFKHPKHNKCILTVNKNKISCHVCYKKPFKIVHKCKYGLRKISYIKSIKLRNGKCKVISKSKTLSCSKCPKDDKIFVTNCNKHGYLTIITKYSIRVKNCCRYRLNTRKFLCKTCPKRIVRRTICSEGYRLRHIYYYVRTPNSSYGDKPAKVKCVRRIYTKKEKCKSFKRCHDEMSSEFCLEVLKSGACHNQDAPTAKLCKMTCGLC